jgi:hypothetical protein
MYNCPKFSIHLPSLSIIAFQPSVNIARESETCRMRYTTRRRGKHITLRGKTGKTTNSTNLIILQVCARRRNVLSWSIGHVATFQSSVAQLFTSIFPFNGLCSSNTLGHSTKQGLECATSSNLTRNMQNLQLLVSLTGLIRTVI